MSPFTRQCFAVWLTFVETFSSFSVLWFVELRKSHWEGERSSPFLWWCCRVMNSLLLSYVCGFLGAGVCFSFSTSFPSTFSEVWIIPPLTMLLIHFNPWIFFSSFLFFRSFFFVCVLTDDDFNYWRRFFHIFSKFL